MAAMRRSIALAVISTVAACGSKSSTPPEVGSASGAAPAPGAPVGSAVAKAAPSVAFGDCASTKVAFVSGPRPLPFARLDAEHQHEDLVTKTETHASLSDSFDDTTIYGGLLPNEEAELNGGFGYGRSGVGPSGTGGTVWGTIGHGNGSGYGRNDDWKRQPRSPVPTISIGKPTVEGDLDKAIIRRYIKRNIPKVQYCYEKQLLANDTLEGTVTTRFVIDENGSVASASAEGVDKEVASCIARVMKDIQFPKPKSGGIVRVTYPFTFRRADRTPSPPPRVTPPSSGSAVATGSGSPPPRRVVLRFASRGEVDAGAYATGTANPLVLQQTAIADCLRDATPYGSGVVDLTYDVAGKVTDATVDGIADAKVATCIATAAKLTTRAATTDDAAERCAFAFGTQPIASLPAIELTATDLVFGGASIAKHDTDALAAGMARPLTEQLAAAQQKVTAGEDPKHAVHPPYLVKVAAGVTTQKVTRVLDAILANGDDFVLESSKLSLPIVPVPFATGGNWAPVQPQQVTAAQTVRISDKAVYLGEAMTARDDLAKTVATAIAKHPKTEPLAIAADASVPWSDVVTTIAAVEAAGYTYRLRR